MRALAEVLELEAERLADVEQPLEVGRAVAVDAALHRPDRRDDVGVAALEGWLRAGRLEDDAELVREDLLALTHVLDLGRVDDLAQLRQEEEVRED